MKSITSQNIIYGLHLDGRDVRYVGQTSIGLANRLAGHFKDARQGVRRPVCQWVRKYGETEIRAEVLDILELSVDLDDFEIYWINKLSTHISLGGLNLTLGGRSTRNYNYTRSRVLRQHTASSKATLSAAATLQVRDESWRQAVIEGIKNSTKKGLTQHRQWHIDRGVVSEYCSWCVKSPATKPPKMSRSESARLSNHNRRHTNLRITSPHCGLCTDNPTPRIDYSEAGHRKYHVNKKVVQKECRYCVN